MGRPSPKLLLRTAADYLKQHPDELLRVLRGLFGLRLGVPMDALRYLVREFGGGKKAPKDVVLASQPPGLKAALTVDAMGTPLRASLVVFIEELALSEQELKIGIRIEGLELKVLGESSSPIAGLLKSGALDLSKPGNLVAFMPKRPAFLVDAKDDRLTFDLMKVPKLAENAKVRRMLGILTPVVGVKAIRTRDDHLDVHLGTTLSRLPEAIAAARAT
jgi:hypothetical protein